MLRHNHLDSTSHVLFPFLAIKIQKASLVLPTHPCSFHFSNLSDQGGTYFCELVIIKVGLFDDFTDDEEGRAGGVGRCKQADGYCWRSDGGSGGEYVREWV